MEMGLTDHSGEQADPVASTNTPAGQRRRRIGRYIAVPAVALTAGLIAYGWMIEPHWLAVRHIKISSTSQLRIAHISDLHYAGNDRLMQRAVREINASDPDLVCITGDFVSNSKWLPEALAQLDGLQAPVYAVPGNWDYWSGADLDLIAAFCEGTGGKLLLDETVVVENRDVAISGALGESLAWIPTRPAGTHVMLVHYPLFVDSLGEQQFDLILAGHSHGGQVRLPWTGAIAVPYGVGRYDLGLFRTANGPLYVTSGVGTSAMPLRLGCRPEVAIIDL